LYRALVVTVTGSQYHASGSTRAHRSRSPFIFLRYLLCSRSSCAPVDLDDTTFSHSRSWFDRHFLLFASVVLCLCSAGGLISFRLRLIQQPGVRASRIRFLSLVLVALTSADSHSPFLCCHSKHFDFGCQFFNFARIVFWIIASKNRYCS
jgi:hypothetical protein